MSDEILVAIAVATFAAYTFWFVKVKVKQHRAERDANEAMDAYESGKLPKKQLYEIISKRRNDLDSFRSLLRFSLIEAKDGTENARMTVDEAVEKREGFAAARMALRQAYLMREDEKAGHHTRLALAEADRNRQVAR